MLALRCLLGRQGCPAHLCLKERVSMGVAGRGAALMAGCHYSRFPTWSLEGARLQIRRGPKLEAGKMWTNIYRALR